MGGLHLLAPGRLELDRLTAWLEDPPLRLELEPAARADIDAAAALVAQAAAGEAPVYGVNTGFGKLARVRIAPADIAELQRRLVLSHMCGVGTPLDDGTVRLILLLKAGSLALGRSGVRQATVDALLRLLAEDALPVIPGQGSVGASGDLAPLAHVAAALIGVGRVRLRGQELPAAEALAAIGLAPLALAAKEGLALLNGTQVSTALAIGGLLKARRLFDAALVAGAMSTDAALGSDVPFDPRIQRARNQPGQAEVAAILAGLLAGSEIRSSHLDCERVQDPYSVRCQPQVMGARQGHAGRGRRHAGARGQRRLRQSPGLRRRGGDPLRRQLPCRAGGLRCRQDRGGHGRDRQPLRAAHGAADQLQPEQSAGLPHAPTRA